MYVLHNPYLITCDVRCSRSGTFAQTLKFITRDTEEGEPIGRGQRDECELDELDMSESDFMLLGMMTDPPTS